VAESTTVAWSHFDAPCRRHFSATQLQAFFCHVRKRWLADTRGKDFDEDRAERPE
jgi:hypothetical protein